MSKVPNEMDFLRTEAEAQLIRETPTEKQGLSAEELQHELQVHQIELEMQNDELRQTQVSQEETLARYVDLYDFAPVGYFTLTGNSEILSANLTGAAMLGIERKKLLRRRFTTFVVPQDSDRLHLCLKSMVQQGDKQSCELSVKRGDGSVFHARLDCLQSKFDNQFSIRIALTDITEHKLGEEKLHASEGLLRLFIDRAPVSLAMFDCKMRYLAVSRRWMEDFSLGDRDIIGVSHYEIFPEIQEGWKSVHRRGLGGEEIRADEDCFERADGTIQWLRWEVLPWRTGDGAIGGIIIFSEDITRYKQAEEEIRNLNAVLEQRVEERTAQLTAEIVAREQLEQALMQYAAIIDSSDDAIIGKTLEGIITSWNCGAERMFGYTREEVLGRPISFLIPEQYQHEEVMLLEQIRTGIFVKHYETVRRCKDGTLINVSVALSPLRDHDGNIVGASKIARNITERKQAEVELRIAAAAFETHDAIVITDANANIIKVNRAFVNVTGYSDEEVLGKNPRLMKSGRHDKAFYVKMWQQLLHEGSWAGEIWDKRKNGEIYPRWMTITAVKDEQQKTTQYVGIFSDITDRKKNEELIRHLAFYDTLTQLPNRRMLGDRLGQAMAANKRSGIYGAVMFMDLDNFKPLNDTHGHVVGDLLLIEVARRISSCLREMDTVARFGGDEFVVILSELDVDETKSREDASIVAEKIRACLAETYNLTLQQENATGITVEHHCTSSIGVKLFIGHEASQDDILKWADIAMYQAKKDGGNSIRFYEAKD